MGKRTYCQECSCWVDYPNMNREQKCRKYVNINNHIGYKRKTHCIRKDVIFGFIKEKDNGLCLQQPC